ncbi:hypothetical protein ONZ45_g12490 [Pleurotus djamor]|nr:hypothetical protein ONZ45_g12490 [Pleurotus djamor]
MQVNAVSSMAKRHHRARSNRVLSFNIQNDNIFGLDADNELTDATFVATVNRVSEDGRRIYQHSLTIPAPSPQRQFTDLSNHRTPSNSLQSTTHLPTSVPLDSIWEDISDDEGYLPQAEPSYHQECMEHVTVEGDGYNYSQEAQGGDDPEVGKVEAQPKKATRYVSSDEPLKEWLPFQEEYLNELVQHEALVVFMPIHFSRYIESGSGTENVTFLQVSKLLVFECNLVIAPEFLAPIRHHSQIAPAKLVSGYNYTAADGKITMYDYYSAMEKLTDNIFTSDLPARYKEITRIFREYRHLIALKRGGRICEEGGISATQNGDLAVVCPACPDPEVNLPSNWAMVPKEQRYIYTLFIALDACFRLKRRLVSSVKKDPGLGIGWSYFVEREPFRKYLLGVTDQKEISTCSGLAALDYANTKFSRGYAVTGVCLGVCARHEMIQRNGAVDLQVGERYANMDYCFGSLLRHYDPRLNLLVSYDIACQWGKDAVKRIGRLPPLVRSMITGDKIRFAIPKLHIHSHTKYCQETYSLNYLPGVGRTDGEGIERPWANIGATATSTRVMGPGAREETLNQHWGHWNWQKLIGLGSLLKKRLKNALKEQSLQKESFAVFSAKQGERTEDWEQLVNSNPCYPNQQ